MVSKLNSIITTVIGKVPSVLTILIVSDQTVVLEPGWDYRVGLDVAVSPKKLTSTWLSGTDPVTRDNLK